jgi:hypothetical protein
MFENAEFHKESPGWYQAKLLCLSGGILHRETS